MPHAFNPSTQKPMSVSSRPTWDTRDSSRTVYKKYSGILSWQAKKTKWFHNEMKMSFTHFHNYTSFKECVTKENGRLICESTPKWRNLYYSPFWARVGLIYYNWQLVLWNLSICGSLHSYCLLKVEASLMQERCTNRRYNYKSVDLVYFVCLGLLGLFSAWP